MDLITSLPDDNSPVTKKDQYFVDMITSEMEVPYDTSPQQQLPMQQAPPNMPDIEGGCVQLDGMFNKFKNTIIVGAMAALIFSPLLDFVLNKFLGPIQILLLKIVLFMVLYYIFIVSRLSKK